VWTLSVRTGKLHQLVSDALGGAALSPDQSLIIFQRISVPEIWIMKANGEEPRKLLSVTPDRVHYSRLAWFPDSRRIAFAGAVQAGEAFAIRSYDLDTGRTRVILSDPKCGDFCLTKNGRIVYSRLEDPPNQNSANLWEMSIDLASARVRGNPRRLTNWPGSLFTAINSTGNDRQLSFARLHYQNSVYVGQLEENNSRLTNPRRFSFEQWTNWPTGWSRESAAIFFNSDREGRPNIFRQPIGGSEVRALAVGPDVRSDGRLSPDGKWLLYMEWPVEKGVVGFGNGRMVRAAVNGGPGDPVFPISGYSKRGRTDPLISLSAEGHPAFRCPIAPGSPCVLSEEIQGEVVFTAFNPMQGRKGALRSIPASSFSFWDLSPDGRWIALGKNEETNGRIRLVSLAGEAPREIQAGDCTHLMSVAWASDGKALFATAFASKGAPLLRVALDGKTQILYRGLKYVENPVASPDGQFIAFGEMTEDGNVWVLDTPGAPANTR
jgi:Tol biopolymer transport system component